MKCTLNSNSHLLVHLSLSYFPSQNSFDQCMEYKYCLSVFCPLPSCRFQGQQVQKPRPLSIQSSPPALRDTYVFPSHPWDIIFPVCSETILGMPPSRTCPKNISYDTPGRQLSWILKPHQLPSFSVEEKWLYSKSLSPYLWSEHNPM